MSSKTLGKPEPNSDVINKEPTVLIVGYGWVGQFIGKYFKNAHWVAKDGKFHRVSDNKKVKPLVNYELGFICVPTPMLPSGQCDTSIIWSVVRKYHKIVEWWCCKSTVEIGTCDKIRRETGAKICMSPEYVGETLGHPLVEPKRDTFVVLGGARDVTEVFAKAWSLVTNSYTKIYQFNNKTAELGKLMENTWIGLKVLFVNTFSIIAGLIGVDFNELRELWLADPRVSRSHTYAYPNNRGFSGKCLPKDINNLAWFCRNVLDKPQPLLEFMLKYNAELRKDYKDSVQLLPSKEYGSFSFNTGKK